MKHIITILILTSLLYPQVTGGTKKTYKYPSFNYTTHITTKTTKTTSKKTSKRKKSDVVLLEWADWSNLFIKYYNECLQVRGIRYVTSIKKNQFNNTKVSSQCYKYAKQSKNGYLLGEASKRKKREWENMQRDRIKNKKKINIIVSNQ